MMYLHFCTDCRQTYILSGHQQECVKCGGTLVELKLSYQDYVDYSPAQRRQLILELEDPEELARQKRHYRFSKQTKRYKEWMKRKEDISR
ncbi:MAG TPA: hypothetical protein PLU43_03045 [Lachnospiraceae bacterium]|nr:hypothetical protein [Lachnospiraceae bacterium]